ncbi:hypothetical protein D3C72_1191530 [compost metagenome]
MGPDLALGGQGQRAQRLAAEAVHGAVGQHPRRAHPNGATAIEHHVAFFNQLVSNLHDRRLECGNGRGRRTRDSLAVTHVDVHGRLAVARSGRPARAQIEFQLGLVRDALAQIQLVPGLADLAIIRGVGAHFDVRGPGRQVGEGHRGAAGGDRRGQDRPLVLDIGGVTHHHAQPPELGHGGEQLAAEADGELQPLAVLRLSDRRRDGEARQALVTGALAGAEPNRRHEAPTGTRTVHRAILVKWRPADHSAPSGPNASAVPASVV